MRIALTAILTLLLIPYSVRGDVVQIPEEVLALRDPFKRLVIKAQKTPEIKNPLEKYAVEELRLVGVLTGPERIKAMIMAPDGQSFFVSEKMKLGSKNGYVRKITREAVYVREKLINLLGQEEHVDTEIKIGPEGKQNRQDPLVSSEIVPIKTSLQQPLISPDPRTSPVMSLDKATEDLRKRQ